MVKNLPSVQETWVRSLGQEDSLEKGMATHSGILAWKIQRTEEPGELKSMGAQRVGHDWVTDTFTFTLLTHYSNIFGEKITFLYWLCEDKMRIWTLILSTYSPALVSFLALSVLNMFHFEWFLIFLMCTFLHKIVMFFKLASCGLSSLKYFLPSLLS